MRKKVKTQNKEEKFYCHLEKQSACAAREVLVQLSVQLDHGELDQICSAALADSVDGLPLCLRAAGCMETTQSAWLSQPSKSNNGKLMSE